MTITFAASTDPNGVTIVDSIKVYGKTKEAFAWPDDHDDYQPLASSSQPPVVAPSSSSMSVPELDSHQSAQLTALDRLLVRSLDVLDGCFHLATIPTDPKERQLQRDNALEIATELLTLPYTEDVESNVKSLLVTLHSSRGQYNNHRDRAIVNYVINNIDDALKNDQLDGQYCPLPGVDIRAIQGFPIFKGRVGV